MGRRRHRYCRALRSHYTHDLSPSSGLPGELNGSASVAAASAPDWQIGVTTRRCFPFAESPISDCRSRDACPELAAAALCPAEAPHYSAEQRCLGDAHPLTS